MPIYKVAEFAPDAAALYMPDVTDVAYNCVPRTDNTDGPLKGQVTASDALSATCAGAFSLRDQNNNTYVFAGTTTDLYELAADQTWTNRTRLTTPPSGSALDVYAVTVGEHWRFCQFGQRVIATNFTDEIQTYNMLAPGRFSNLSSAAPVAKYVATIEPGFLMTGFTGSTGGGAMVWWSAFDDPTDWPTPGTAAAQAVQSDNQILHGGGQITGILPAIGGAAGAVFTERAITRMEYVGPPAVFAFREVDRSRGCIAPQSLVQIGGSAMFLSEDGFCAFDGSSVSMIGAGKVDRFFFQTVDQSKLNRVYGAADMERKLLIWAFPSSSATNPNRWLVYNFATNRWRYGDDADLTVEYLSTFRQPGYLLDTTGGSESIGTLFPVNGSIGGIDTAGGITVDTTIYQGGNRFLGGFNTSHELVSFTGQNLAARVETSDAGGEGRRLWITGVEPLTDAADFTAQIGYRSVLSDPLQYSTATHRGHDRVCFQRVAAGFARARVNIPAGETWTHLYGCDVTFRREGRR